MLKQLPAFWITATLRRAILYNFGIEGKSYKVENNEYIYTDEMFNDPEGKSISDALGYYVRATGSGPFIQDPSYIMQYYQTQQQKDALALWADQKQRTPRCPPSSTPPMKPPSSPTS